jgi:hypothetical protein
VYRTAVEALLALADRLASAAVVAVPAVGAVSSPAPSCRPVVTSAMVPPADVLRVERSLRDGRLTKPTARFVVGRSGG